MTPGITAIILAGGQGSRMGGQDKGLVYWRDKALAKHVIDCVSPQTDNLIISCNRNLEQYSQWANNICPDNLSGYQGPLAGLQAALTITSTEFSLVCACDTPQLPKDLTLRLMDSLKSMQVDICYPYDGKQKQYLPALISTSLLGELNKYLANGHRSIKGWYSGLRVASADFSDCPDAFININNVSTLTKLSAAP